MTLGVNLRLSNLLVFWQNSSLLWRSLLATVVLPPLVVAQVMLVVKVPESLAIALVLLVAAPGPPLLIKRAGQAGGH